MEVRTFDPKQPTGTMSLDNLRNNFLALYQGDLGFLRPRNDYIHDDFEYADPSAITPTWVDETDLTLSLDSTVRKYGNYSMKVITDASEQGEISRACKISDLTSFLYVDFWVRSSASSHTIRFVILGGGHTSYWDFTITTADTWQNITLDLSSPDGNDDGTDADLSSVTAFFFIDMAVSTTYHFDQIRFICGNCIVIEGTENSDDVTGNYRRNVWLNKNAPVIKPTSVVSGFSLPVSGVRKDLVVLRYSDPVYSFVIIEGTSSAYPAPEIGDIPICYVYLRAGQARIVGFTDKDNYASDGYIEADVRPFIQTDSDRYNITQGAAYPTEVTIDGSELTSANWIDFFVRNATGTARRQMAQIDYTGLQLYAAGVLAGAKINEFSTDGTFADNSDTAVPTEKAVKSYVDSKLIKHFINGGLVTVSGNNLVVDPAFLWLNGKTLTEAAQITKDATVSGNYIGTDISASAGFVYVYAKDDGAGGYDVYLSGDAPNRSDCNAGATTGKLIYRDFSSSWYRFLGARYKTAGAVKACYCSNDGFVQYDEFIEIATGATYDGEVNAYMPVTAQRGLFEVEAIYGSGQVIVQIKPSSAATEANKVSGVWAQYYPGFGQVVSMATNVSGVMKIYVYWINGNETYPTNVKTAGYWEAR